VAFLSSGTTFFQELSVVLEQHLSKQMPLINTPPHPPNPHPPDVVFTVMVQVAAITQHRQVSWVVVGVVLIKVRQREDNALAGNGVRVFVGSTAPLTAPVVAGCPQIV
jgi:hypothetical protein